MGYGSIAGTPAFMIAEPITTKRKYASAMLKAVGKSVKSHPYVITRK
jgi:hypothetical protein